MVSTWLTEGVTTEDEKWMKLVCPLEYVKESESEFCRCGHHVGYHGYSRDDEHEKFFRFENLGKYKGETFCFDSTCLRKDPDCVRLCPCKGFEPHNIEKEAVS